ncbi:hypothetical protein SAMN04487980_1001316 [Streptomyces sp. cf124]|uniref:hypothetical protein n=1 Tax=Streptomyces sp. cf124 TaxID=1761903 RepID=UPI0008E5F45E|nr:hypothetical protein [Streptomyces sp. cf124]SFM44213.1 hypothetical protein SAMN04487980_1001316 [Streptomyces sp. cf124]
MPAPAVACWTHLTASEREQYKAARSRRAKEHLDRCTQLEQTIAAARAGAAPQQAIRDPRPCTGRCITVADLHDRENPGEYYDHSDSAIIACAHCDETVCILCRDRNHALNTPCTSPSTIPDDIQA